jgi:membrane-associated phospholipid phosphatase
VNARLRPTVGRLLTDARFSLAPFTRDDVWRQAMIMLLCYVAYDISRALAQGREAVALANGVFFMNLEKALGIWWEPWVQARVSAIDPLMTVLVWIYQYAHLPIIIGAMVWVFSQRRGSWILYRNWFLAMNFVAVIVFALLPTAPPRMIFTSGVADINFLHGVRQHILENGLLANPFAAMPSLHFGYALFIGIMLYTLAHGRWTRYLGFLYALVVLVAIVATGNHFIIDAAAGALVVLAAWVFAVNVQPSAVPQSAVTLRERDG